MDYLLGVHDSVNNNRINAAFRQPDIATYHYTRWTSINTANATKVNSQQSNEVWCFLRSIPEVANLYSGNNNIRENHLPLAFRDLLDDLPLIQVYEMETRKTLVEREEWFQWFIIHLERCAQAKGICTEELANEIHRWGVYCLQRIHEIFTNIEMDFKVEQRIWETAIQFQTPARPPITMSASSSIGDWPGTRRSCSASPLRSRFVGKSTNAAIPELIGPLMNWQPVFDAESSGSPSDDESPVMCIASA